MVSKPTYNWGGPSCTPPYDKTIWDFEVPFGRQIAWPWQVRPLRGSGHVRRWFGIAMTWGKTDIDFVADNITTLSTKGSNMFQQFHAFAPWTSALMAQRDTKGWLQWLPEVVECLDGLHFSFGPASFQQVNLQVFEKILQESLHMSPWISWEFHGHFMGISWGFSWMPCRRPAQHTCLGGNRLQA